MVFCILCEKRWIVRRARFGQKSRRYQQVGVAPFESQGSIFYVRNLQIPPPPSPVLQTSPIHTFSQKFSAVFRTFRGKFKELGCKIYTPYGFLMLIQLFLYLLLIFYVHFPQFFVIACYFPPFCKSWEVTNFPLAYKFPPPSP